MGVLISIAAISTSSNVNPLHPLSAEFYYKGGESVDTMLFIAILFLGIVSILSIISVIIYLDGNLYIKFFDKNKIIEIQATHSDFDTHN